MFRVFQSKRGFALTIFALLLPIASKSAAQRPRFPDFFQAQASPTGQFVAPPPGQIITGPVVGSPIVGAPIQAVPTVPPTGSLVAPAFDPFATNVRPLPFGNGGVANTTPSLSAPITRSIEVLPPVAQPAPQTTFPGFQGGPIVQQPGPPQAIFGNPQFGQPLNGSPAATQQGPLFPRASQTGQFFRRFQDEFLPRLLERPRFRHTYVAGDNGNELQMHDTEFATTLVIPRFLFIEQPLRITPGFIAHFWDGPVATGQFGTGFDLPETAFSAFLNLEHVTNPDMQGGLETSFTVGVYSDYEHLSSDSFRLTGVVLGWARLNQANVFKFGLEYFDRLELKLLPAFGLFIRPTPDLELDLYFPRPRIAQRYPNFRNLELWGYIAGEYGGGSWTVQRFDFAGMTSFDDQIDINDFRATIGVEWVGPRNVNGFIETGYVFNRELVSQLSLPARELQLQDSVLIRMGLAF